MSRLSFFALAALLTVDRPRCPARSERGRGQRDSGPKAIVGRVVDPSGRPVPEITALEIELAKSRSR